MAEGKIIPLKIGGDEIGAWHVKAKGTRIGGLILVQEIFGLTENIRQICASYAEEGYEVVAPSLFDRLEKNFQGDYSPQQIARAQELAQQNGVDNAVADVQACIDFLKPPVFLTGYCYGGSVVWASACRCRGLTAAVSYYGRLIIDHVNEQPKVPTILHFGETDDTIPMDNVRQIEAAHPDMEVYIYPAGHGFNSAVSPHYNKECATLARERTLAHFQAHLP